MWFKPIVAWWFESQGYVMDEGSPDFTVAVYASAREKLEVTYWKLWVSLASVIVPRRNGPRAQTK